LAAGLAVSLTPRWPKTPRKIAPGSTLQRAELFSEMCCSQIHKHSLGACRWARVNRREALSYC